MGFGDKPAASVGIEKQGEYWAVVVMNADGLDLALTKALDC